MPMTLIWELCLIIAMSLLAWQFWTSDARAVGPSGATPADY